MANGDFNPSKCLITKAKVTSFNTGKTENIIALIGKWSISQSIDSASYSIVLSCADTLGWLEGDTPFGEVRGEEEIELSFHCMDLDTKVNIKGVIYKIDAVQATANHGGLVYDLHVMSKTTFDAASKRITEAFKEKTASEVARTIFNKYFTKIGGTNNMGAEQLPLNAMRGGIDLNGDAPRAVYIEPSADTLSLKTIIPNLPSQSAMKFLAQRGYSEKSKSSSYRFFETLNGYYWVTDEWLIDFGKNNPHRRKELVYNPVTSLDPADAELQIKTIENMINSQKVNDADDITSGGYKNRCFQIDLLRGKVTDTLYEYDTGEFTDMGQGSILDDIHTPEWIKQYTNKNNAKRFITFVDYKEKNVGVNRPKQFYPEIISQRLKHEHHIQYTSAMLQLKGRLDIEPGMIIDVKAKKFNSTKKEAKDNKRYSGNYLVKSTKHSMEDDVLTTTLHIVKYASAKV